MKKSNSYLISGMAAALLMLVMLAQGKKKWALVDLVLTITDLYLWRSENK